MANRSCRYCSAWKEALFLFLVIFLLPEAKTECMALWYCTLKLATPIFHWACPWSSARRHWRPVLYFIAPSFTTNRGSFCCTHAYRALKQYSTSTSTHNSETPHVVQVCRYLYEVFLRSVRCWRRSCSGGLVPRSAESLPPFDGDQSMASDCGTNRSISALTCLPLYHVWRCVLTSMHATITTFSLYLF